MKAKSAKNQPHVYERLAKAFKQQTGIRLDSFDVQQLVIGDDAIHTVVMDYIYPSSRQIIKPAQTPK